MGLGGIKALEDCLMQSKTIKELNLSGNNMGDEGLAIVCNALLKHKRLSLQKLCLSSNKISDSGCTLICQIIRKCETLEELTLANNEIENGGADELIKVLQGEDSRTQQLRSEIDIDIDNNKISGTTLTNLLNKLKLKSLNLMRNELSDQQVAPISQTLQTNLAIQ
jgi:NLR family CARD domain-containing protein 3